MARTKKQKTEPLPSVTEQELARGRAFAAWLSNAIKAAGTNAYQLSLHQHMPSSTYLYWLLDNGISNIGEYKRPSEELVRLLATELRANVQDALKAAGYDSNPQTPPLASALAHLPLDFQNDLIDLLDRARGLTIVQSVAEPQNPYVSVERIPAPTEFVTLPILGFAGAVGETFNIFAEEHQEGDLTLPKSLIKKHAPEKCFIVMVRGDCLRGSMIADGDFAVCVAADTAKDGDIVLVADGDNTILKRYREEIAESGGRYRWLETDEDNGEQNIHRTEYPPRILARMIALHRDL